MERIKAYWERIRKYWITIWLVIAVFAFTSVVSYAAYTRVTVAKRVISTGEGAGLPFGSDLMSSTVKKLKEFLFQIKKTNRMFLLIFSIILIREDLPVDVMIRCMT